MSTIQDLNTAITITYNDEASYAIVFGANAGNTTANVGPLGTANITQQTTLTSITSAVRDLLIDVQFSNVGVVDMNYVGTYSNIGILQIAPAAWRVSGIRSTAQYTEAMANVKYTDLTGIVYDVAPNYSYVTTVNDQSGNTRTWNTTVDVNAYVNNMINRTYTTNTITQLFSTSTPSLDDEPDVGQTYTITLNSSLGKFGNSNAYFTSNTWANIANTYTFTGNTVLVNADFANIRFAPTNRVSGNGTFTYTQSRSGNTQVSLVKTLTANVQPLASGNTYTFTANSSFTPTFDQAQYGIANILVVGGGGSAEETIVLIGPGGANSKFDGGAGGGGEVKWITYSGIDNTTYAITVGSGGQSNTANAGLIIGNAGGISSMSAGNITITADGGYPGIRYTQVIIAPNGFPYTPFRYAAIGSHGGNGGGNLSVGNITGGIGGGQTVGNTLYSNGTAGVLTGNTATGSQGGGGGGWEGNTGLAGNAGPGLTHSLTGNLVLGGGGGGECSFPVPPGGNSTSPPGGNSYGLGGNAYGASQTGTDGVVIINIS